MADAIEIPELIEAHVTDDGGEVVLMLRLSDATSSTFRISPSLAASLGTTVTSKAIQAAREENETRELATAADSRRAALDVIAGRAQLVDRLHTIHLDEESDQ